MATNQFRLVRRPPKAAQSHKIFRDEIREGLQDVGKQAETAYRRVVSNWSDTSRPDFEARVTSGAKQITITVKVVGNKFQKFIWRMIDKTGRKPGKIFPKASNKSGLLSFPWGGPGSYGAKTGARPARFGGPGVIRNAKPTVRAFVNHPGFAPRKFSEVINPTIEKETVKGIRNAGRRALRKIKGSR